MTVCGRCKGLGFTNWDAFVTGLANLIACLIPPFEPLEPVCRRCYGSGSADRKDWGDDS
jgi:hypothetical protein